MGATCQSNRSTAGNQINLTGPGSQEVNKLRAEEGQAKLDEKDTKDKVTVLQQELQSKKDILNGWLSHHPLKTADEFFDYAVKKIIQPGIDKYNKLFVVYEIIII